MISPNLTKSIITLPLDTGKELQVPKREMNLWGYIFAPFDQTSLLPGQHVHDTLKTPLTCMHLEDSLWVYKGMSKPNPAGIELPALSVVKYISHHSHLSG